MSNEPFIEHIHHRFEADLAQGPTLYEALNRFRGWFNDHVANYELYLEDQWYDGRTVIEYLFRSLDTLSSSIPLAGDTYLNSIDPKRFFNLGDYQSTDWMVQDPWGEMLAFFLENPAPIEKIEQ